MTKEKEETVITTKRVAKYVGILAGVIGVVYLVLHLFGIEEMNWNTVNWNSMILIFGSCFACLALSRKEENKNCAD